MILAYLWLGATFCFLYSERASLADTARREGASGVAIAVVTMFCFGPVLLLDHLTSSKGRP